MKEVSDGHRHLSDSKQLQSAIERALQRHHRGKTDEACALLAEILKRNSKYEPAIGLLASLEKIRGNQLTSLSLFKQLNPDNPSNAQWLHNFAGLLLDSGKIEQACTIALQCIALKPNDFNLRLRLSAALKQKGNLKEAIRATQTALTLAPTSAKTFINLADLLLKNHKHDSSRRASQTAVQLAPDHEDTYSILASSLEASQQLLAARRALYKDLQLNPKRVNTNLRLANLERAIGHFETSQNLLKNAMQMAPHLTAPYFGLATLIRCNEDAKWLLPHVELALEQARKTSASEQEDSQQLHFALAHCFHQLKDFERSAEQLQAANRIRLRYRPSDLEVQLKHLNENPLWWKPSPYGSCATGEIGPVFIVGLPRSGSTLTERILSANPHCYCAGEFKGLEKAVQETRQISLRAPTNLAQLYFNKLPKQQTNKVIIDKMLYNLAHVEVILNHFCNARILHCQRHPLDNILSLYRSNFSDGQSYTSDLQHCAKLLIAQHRLMKRHHQYNSDRIRIVNYDLLVSCPDQQVKDLVQWLGWEWNEHYLHPQQSSNAIHTSSDVQARQCISSKSIGQWRHYESLLRPARRLLEASGDFPEL